MIYSIYYSIFIYTINIVGFPGGSEHKESACDMGDLGLIPGLGRSPWRREWLPTPVFWPGKFHGQRSLADCSPRGCKRLDTTEWPSLFHNCNIYKYKYSIQIYCISDTHFAEKLSRINSTNNTLSVFSRILWTN